MTRNEELWTRMTELGLKQEELADRMSMALETLTGRAGQVSTRTVWNLLHGRTRRPIGRTRVALEMVFNCDASELGFTPSRPAPPQEDDVRRRKLFGAATAAASSVVGPILAKPQVGMSDITRLRSELDRLVLLDDTQGGHQALESAALNGMQLALKWQQSGATQRVRHRLYSVAADYTARAAWACFDGRAFDRAQAHLSQATALAGLSQEGYTQFQSWNIMSMVAHRQGRHADAVAAAEAAQAVAAGRREPLLISLAHARTAVAHAGARDTQPALRSIGRAQEALSRNNSESSRPSWLDFYGAGELSALSAVVQLASGKPAQSEASAHRALAATPPRFRRNRAMVTARLAIAQLRQGDVEQSYATATGVFNILSGTPLPARLRTDLGEYHRALLQRAPTSVQARDWQDRMHEKWS
ncbi:XRE family transcriptional regulator [Streptomyces uncialis]|uniref:XRE family transcriptional regulator n=1 Tax=Streptomyces uncialis TaxID=1048205 RepID=UPI0038035E3E